MSKAAPRFVLGLWAAAGILSKSYFWELLPPTAKEMAAVLFVESPGHSAPDAHRQPPLSRTASFVAFSSRRDR